MPIQSKFNTSASKLKVGVIADTTFLRHIVAHAVTSQGYEIGVNFAPDAIDFDVVAGGTLDVWLVELEDEDKWAEVVDQLLEQVTVPIFFGDGQAPSQTSAQFPRWQRRIFTKLSDIIGRPPLLTLQVDDIEEIQNANQSESTHQSYSFSKPDISSEKPLSTDPLNTDPLSTESINRRSSIPAPSDLVPLAQLATSKKNSFTKEVQANVEPPISERQSSEQLQDLNGPTEESLEQSHNSLTFENSRSVTPRPKEELPDQVWVLGASLGGPASVKLFLDQLPGNLPVAFVLAQHIDGGFQDVLAQVLGRHNGFSVSVAHNHQRLRKGDVVIVPVAYEIKFNSEGEIQVTDVPWDGPYAPSIDQVILNVGQVFGKSSGAIIFSGMGNDSAIAGPQMKELGGVLWAQSADSCANSSQPDCIRDTGCISFSGTPQALAFQLVERIRQERKQRETCGH